MTNKILNKFVKIFIFLLIYTFPSFAQSNEQSNFLIAIEKAFLNSEKIRSANLLLQAKEKLIENSYSGKDWNSSFTSTFTFNNKLYDHKGSYLSEEINLNTLSLKKKIFDGGVSKKQTQIAKKDLEIEKNNFFSTKQTLILDTVKSYLNFYKSIKIVKLRETSVDKFQTHVKASKLKLLAGAITPTNVAEAEASLARGQYQLVLASDEMDQFKNEFLSVVGHNFEFKKLILPKVNFILPSSIKEAMSIALKNNPTILNSNISKKLALLKRDKQILSKKPTFDIDFQYKNSETSASSSSNDFQSYGTILTFKTPLFNNRSEKHLILSLHDEYKSIFYNHKETLRSIRLNVSSTYNAYKNSFLNTNAAKKELNAAKLALEGVKKEEEFGMRTLLDVLDNEVNVINAEVKLLESKANEVLQKFNLKSVIGTLRIEDLIKDFNFKMTNESNYIIPNIFDFDF